MSDQSKQMRLEQLREIARRKIYEALDQCERLPEDLRDSVTLGTFFDGDDRVFELYLPRKLPQDAVVIARVRVNSRSGEASAAEVFLPMKTSKDSSQDGGR